jgi:potassium-transporting ATPase KdpC subunit
MLQHLRACIFLLILTVLICCVLYPLALWGIAKAAFSHKAEGSLVNKEGKSTSDAATAVGSLLIAQPFTGDEYFQPRPSAASFNGAASGASNWSANNYLLRERVARQLGPIARYRGGPKDGQLVGPDIEAWFQKDRLGGKSGIVAQWAQAHASAAQAWVKADKVNTDHVAAWQKANGPIVAQWIKDNPDTPEPKPEDLAVPFFTDFSKSHPGMFLAVVEKKMQPVKEGSEIQGYFFDSWLQENPQVQLEEVPADMVMASGSGLDPHITLKNAQYQLNRVASKWAKESKRDEAQVRKEIDNLLNQKAFAPLGGLAGVKLINVLETNLALRELFKSS